jgi:hypothetical protein
MKNIIQEKGLSILGKILYNGKIIGSSGRCHFRQISHGSIQEPELQNNRDSSLVGE